MNTSALHRISLRRTLIAVLLAGVLAGSGVQVWMTWHTAKAAVDAAFDRSLLGAIKAIDANVSTESGGLGVELPYGLFEFFELSASGPVHYRVATADGLVEIGNLDLPLPADPLRDRQAHFATVRYAGSEVRIGTWMRPIDNAVGGLRGRRLVVQVAEPFASRDQFSRQFILDAVARDALLALLAAGMVAAAVAWSLRPLDQLREEVRARAGDDLSPMDTSRVPEDLLPLVEAMNQHIVRHRDLMAAQRQFVDDASHQLRTPLSTMLAQLSFAQRSDDPDALRDALSALREQLRHTIRQTNQMLALARTDTVPLATATADLSALARDVTKARWSEARNRRIDLGFEAPATPVAVPMQRELVEEALSNLLDNALRHAPENGRVTVAVGTDGTVAWVGVMDNGPGIPADELPRATERFFRASNATGPGSGLGLAIVASIARRHGGHVRLGQSSEAGGLRAELLLPLASA